MNTAGVDEERETTVVALEGEIDLSTAPEAEQRIQAAEESSPGRLVVDLREVTAETIGGRVDAALSARLTALIVERLGKPMRPAAIEFVSDLPKTRNAKVMRRVVRAAYAGEAPGDLSSLENPQAVEEIRAAFRNRTR